MKALTLWQPWASLVAAGAKKIETRKWGTSYRGMLAIHAAKSFPVDRRRLVAYGGAFYLALKPHFAHRMEGRGDGAWPFTLAQWIPLGAVVAICQLTLCTRVRTGNDFPSMPERAYGDYSAGRSMWFLDDIRPLPSPIPARGKQGLWEWEAPASVLEALGW